MRLNDIAQAILCRSNLQLSDENIINLTSFADDVKKGSAFFAIQGAVNDGHKFILQAESNGAKLIIYDKSKKEYIKSIIPGLELTALEIDKYNDCYFMATDNVRLALSRAASIFWSDKPEHIVAVTGTSGKTSVAYFTNQLWGLLGNDSAYIGTLGVSCLENKKSLTTPDILSMHNILNQLKGKGIDYVAMEASSHGIVQHRLDNIKLAAAVFTNLGRDHLDYHHTMEEYFLSKMRLFKDLLPSDGKALVFADDEATDRVIGCLSDREVLTIGKSGNFIRLLDKNILIIDGKKYPFDFVLQGKFQLYNALLALGIVISQGANIQDAVGALVKLKPVPGRMELVGKSNKGALCYVDYAHKPEALKSLLLEMRNLAQNQNKVIVVFGCGGDRDRGKRPIMGKIAHNLADIVVVTDDNPRSEIPKNIRNDILQGAHNAIDIGNRSEAIKYAIDIADFGDIVVIAGKGHETGQQIGNKIEPFSDKEEVLKYL